MSVKKPFGGKRGTRVIQVKVVDRIAEASKISVVHADIAYETVRRESLARLLQSGTVVLVKPYDPFRVEALRRSLMVYSLWRLAQVRDIQVGDADALREALRRRLPPRPEIVAGFKVAGVAPIFYVPPRRGYYGGPGVGALYTVFGESLGSVMAAQEFATLSSAAGYPTPMPNVSSTWQDVLAGIVRNGTPICVVSEEYESFTYGEQEQQTVTGAKRETITPLMSLLQALADAPPEVRRHSTVLVFLPEDRLMKSPLEAGMVSEVKIYPKLAEYRAILKKYGVKDLERAVRVVRGLLLFQIPALPGLERGFVDPHEATKRKKSGTATEIIETEGGFDHYVFPREIVDFVRRILVRPLQVREDEFGRILVVIGPVGSGRRTLVKAVAHETGLPLLRVRMEKLFGKYVGETEKNMAAALRDANRVGGILMFANVDSTLFKATGSIGGSSDITERIIGMLMEELVRPDRRFVAAFTVESVTDLPPSFKQLMTDVNVVLFFLDHEMRTKMIKYYLERIPNGYRVDDGEIDKLADHYMLALSTPRDIRDLVATAGYLAVDGPVRYEHLISALQYHWSVGEDKLRFLEMFEDVVKNVPSYLPLIDRYMKNMRAIKDSARIYQQEVRRILAEAIYGGQA